MVGRSDGIGRLLAPRHIAFVGGRNIRPGLDLCRRSGFSGALHVVSDRHEEIDGIACHASVNDLPEPPDAVFIGVGREATVEVVRDLAAMGAGGAVCFAAGFSEIGGDGPALQEALKEAAGPSLALLGPNCLGVLNRITGATMWLVPGSDRRVARGPALITQSGGLGLHIMMNQRSVDFSYVVSVGNQAVLGVEDFIEDFAARKEVTAIAIYLEALRDCGRFHDAALAALERDVPVIVLKGGRSEVGAAMTMTHTSSLAGRPELYEVLFERLGVASVASASELLETVKLFDAGARPRSRDTVVFTCSGGSSGIAADAAARVGIELPPLSAEQAGEIAGHLPAFASVSNPLDYNTSLWGQEEALVPVFSTALSNGAGAGLLAIDFTPAEYGSDHNEYAVCRALVRAGKATGVPVFVASILADLLPAEARRQLIADGVAPLQGIDDGLAALAHAAAFQEARAAPRPDRPLPPAAPGETHLLDENESKTSLSAFGLPVPEARAAAVAEAGAAAEALGFPVALKILDSRIAHKSDVGGVRLALQGRAEVAAAAETMADGVAAKTGRPVERVLVERMTATPVAEMIVGVTSDPLFGPTLVIGAGGTLVEIVKDSALLIMPFTREEAERAVRRLTIASVLAGARGGPAGDTGALVDAMLAIQAFVAAHPGRVLEIDVNPLMVLPEDQGVVAADAIVRLSGSAAPR